MAARRLTAFVALLAIPSHALVPLAGVRARLARLARGLGARHGSGRRRLGMLFTRLGGIG